jgi:hypothetical protein
MSASRRLAGLIVACSAALLAPLVRPLLIGRVFVYNDLSWFHLPTRYLYQQALHAGDTVLWTPSIFAGLYLQGEGQVGLFHPFHQLLYRFLPLGPAFNLELIASYPAAFAGMFWFLRRLRLGHAAALFGAMLFAFSGFNLLHHHHVNMIAVVAHLPWLLAAADVLIADQRPRARTIAFAAMALIVASELLLGFPQAVWWNVMTLAVFAALRAADAREGRQLLACGAAVALGVLLGGIQLLPTADAAAHSVRAGLSRDFAQTFSLHPLNLLQLWSPYVFEQGTYSEADANLFHEFGIYSGAILPVALIWVWIRRHALKERRALITAVTAFAVVNLILALGRYGGLGALLTHIPVLQSLRAPVRYILLVQFALAILAAITVDDLLEIGEGHRDVPSGPMIALWIPAGLSVATLLAVNTRLLPYDTGTFATVSGLFAGIALVASVTLLVFLAARRAHWALVVLVLVTAGDLGVWGIGFIYREPARTIRSLTQAVAFPPDSPADSYASAPGHGSYRLDVLILRGYRLTSGYVGLFPAARHPLDGEIARRLSGTRWIFTPDGSRLPFQGSVERVRLLDEEGHASTGTARMTVDRPGRLVVHVDAPGRRILAFTERFHDGWSATIDDTPLPMVRVEGDFLGCVLDGGVHRVRLRFMPRSFVYGSLMSAAGAVLLAGLLIARLK